MTNTQTHQIINIHHEPEYLTTVMFNYYGDPYAITHIGNLNGIDSYCINSVNSNDYYEYLAADCDFIVDLLKNNPHIDAALHSK